MYIYYIYIYNFFLSLALVVPVGLTEALLDGQPMPISSTGFRFLFIVMPRLSLFSLLREAHSTMGVLWM